MDHLASYSLASSLLKLSCLFEVFLTLLLLYIFQPKVVTQS